MYAALRIVSDAHGQFLLRKYSLKQTIVEVLAVVGIGFAVQYIIRRITFYYDKNGGRLSFRSRISELLLVLGFTLLLVNPVVFIVHLLARDPVLGSDFLVANIILILFVLVYYAMQRSNQLTQVYSHQSLQLERLKNEQLQTELKFLKAQYHPHFLFNALNTIYFQMDEDVDAAKVTVEKFSDLLRYQLYDHQKPVLFDQEMEHLKNYIHLQQQRCSKYIQLKYLVENEVKNQKLYPLLLLPLIENAFKHIGGANYLEIEASFKNGYIYFEVLNSVTMSTGGVSGITGGIGLPNLNRRLKLLYDDSYTFSTEKRLDAFVAKLILPTL